MRRSKSLSYITNIPTPYRLEMIEAWATANPDIDISVYYTDQGDQGRGWNVRSASGVREVRMKVLAGLGKYGKLNWGILRLVLRSDIVMIGGLEQATYLVAAVIARLTGRGPILLFDGFGPKRFGHESWAVLAVKRLTVWLSQAYFANGTVGRAYLQSLGASARKPLFNQLLSHADHFHLQLLEEFRGKPLRERQQAAGFADRPVLMCCGYLIHRKRVDLVIDALALIPEGLRPQLLVVGGGPLMDELKNRASAASISSRFVGHKTGRDLAAYYYLADVFVLASDDDPWGLVINEAMRAGLPVVVSDACGVSLDLVREGENGFIFKHGSPCALQEAIAKTMQADRAVLGRRSREIVSEWTAEASAWNLGKCVSSLCRKGE